MSSLTKFLDINIQNQIDTLVRTTGKPEETVLREVMKAGLRNYPTKPTKGRKALLGVPVAVRQKTTFRTGCVLSAPKVASR